MQRNNILQTWTFPCSACLSFWKSCSKHGKALRNGDDDGAWKACSTTWNVGINCEFCLGQKVPMGNLNRVGCSQDLLEAYWLLTSSPASRHWAPLNNDQLKPYTITKLNSRRLKVKTQLYYIILYHMIWYDMIWYDTIYDMIWYDIILYYIILYYIILYYIILLYILLYQLYYIILYTYIYSGW